MAEKDQTQPHAPRKPDAIRCPRNYPTGPNGTVLDPAVRDRARSRLFGPILGVQAVTNAGLLDRPESLITRTTDQLNESLLFPHGHPMAKQPRYEWWIADWKDKELVPLLPEDEFPDSTGRLLIGYKVEDPYAEDAAAQATIQAELEARAKEAFTDPAHIERLRKLGVLAPEADPATAASVLSPAPSSSSTVAEVVANAARSASPLNPPAPAPPAAATDVAAAAVAETAKETT